jgi:ketosteroid isomerase-like protein
MSKQDVDTIRGGYEAFARQDIPGVMEAFADDIEWDTPDSIPAGGVFHGKEEVGRFFQELGDHYDELRVEPDTFLDAGDHIVALGHHRGRVAGGDAFEVRWAMVWEMRDGKAAKFREYTDTAPIARAVEGAAASA